MPDDSETTLDLLSRLLGKRTAKRVFHRTLTELFLDDTLPDDVKVKLQSYISGCYGSLTTFNVLFADEADQFKGSGGD